MPERADSPASPGGPQECSVLAVESYGELSFIFVLAFIFYFCKSEYNTSRDPRARRGRATSRKITRASQRRRMLAMAGRAGSVVFNALSAYPYVEAKVFLTTNTQ